MSELRNPDSLVNQGEFHPRVKPAEPAVKKWHKPGVIASERDAAPEFHAQTLPPGTAPPDKTYAPNPTDEAAAVPVNASDTLGNTTSKDLNTGLGHPGVGQTSTEIRHDGQHHRAKQGLGLAGLASGVPNKGKLVDERQPGNETQRGIKSEEAGKYAGTKGDKVEQQAQDKEKVSAEELASELPSRVSARGHKIKG